MKNGFKDGSTISDQVYWFDVQFLKDLKDGHAKPEQHRAIQNGLAENATMWCPKKIPSSKS